MAVSDPLFLLVALAVVAVLGVLLLGVGSFGRGGDFNRRNSNRLMRWRVGLQAVAVVLLLLVAWLKTRGG